VFSFPVSFGPFFSSIQIFVSFIIVSALYYQTAERLVSEMELASPEFDAWVCHACHEKVDGTFAVCWNCQAAPADPAAGASE
jgi:hypothetical protein